MGIESRVIGGGRGSISSTMIAEYASCDLVFASGKVAIEAIASGRPVICADERGLAGLVTSDIFLNWRSRNFGGSILNQPIDEIFIANEIRLFDPQDFIILLEKYRSDLLLDTYINRLEWLYAEALAIERTHSDLIATIDLASYLEKVLPLGCGPGTVASPSDLVLAQSDSARFRSEVERLRLESFVFTKERPLTFAEGEAGRAILGEGWRRDISSSLWSDAARSRLIIPRSTGWLSATTIKIEGLVFAPACKPFDSSRRLTFFANGIRKAGLHHTNAPSNKEEFVYCWFEIDEELITMATNGNLEIVLEVDPYVPDASLGRGFWMFQIWAI